MENKAGKSIYILDTNVLLNDLDIINTLPDSTIIIPQIVLVELDKIKFARADLDLKFRARQAGRKLYELTQKGNLSTGVKIGNNSVLKVLVPEPVGEVPVAIRTKSADDQILSLAYHLNSNNGTKATLMTSDINMIVKAQAIGITTLRHEVKEAKKFVALVRSKRWQKRLFTIFTVLLILFLSIPTIRQRFITNNFSGGTGNNQVDIFHQQEKHYSDLLEKNPRNVKVLVSLGNLNFDWQQWSKAIQYYNKALQFEPDDPAVRINMSIALFNTGNQQAAIKGLSDVIKNNPDNTIANYNLAAIYQQTGKSKEAIELYKQYIKLDPQGRFVAEAEANIQRLQLLTNP